MISHVPIFLVMLHAMPASAVLVHQDPSVILPPQVERAPQQMPQKVDDAAQASTIEGIKDTPCSDQELKDKKLDIVVYGATGFTGKHAAYYLASYPSKPRWGMAGRSDGKLGKLREIIGDNATGVESFTVAVNDEEGLRNLARTAKVLMSYAGPYEEAGGESLIRASLEGCAHYIDVSTETKWNAEMQLKYGPLAIARGLALVQGAGFESLVSDFLAVSAAKDYYRKEEVMPLHVKIMYTKVNGGKQGGKMESDKISMVRNGINFDPYILVPGIDMYGRVDKTVDGGTPLNTGYQPEMQTYAVTYPPAFHNCPVVRLSLHQTFPKTAITVKESASTSLMEEMKLFFMKNNNKPRMSLNPPRGEGPPVWLRKEGSFSAEATAFRNTSNYARVYLEGQGDPSNLGTTKMSVELALGLAEHGPKNHTGGYLTPAVVIDTEELERRLSAADGGKFMTIIHTRAGENV